VIDQHPRLGFAVLGGVLVAIVVLVVLIFSGGSGSARIPLDAAPSAADVPSPEPAVQTAKRSTRIVDPAWTARMGARAGIPAPAMQAYADAELVLHRETPGCHLSWNTLAGIGWIESQHGTIGDRTIGADGRSSSPVIGPPLDGKQFAAIRSTPGSAAWHGDATWEHAVGPLQFIASTWDKWSADGDGDGVADPLDLDDAALAAGHYLCADAHDLATASGWSAAVHSYNHSDAYVLSVLSAANTYAERTSPGQ
jgi:membrane-bound lytic murein transglycosylase B